MRKILSFTLVLVLVFSLSSCSGKVADDKPESYYSECNFEKLKTFTEITEIEPTSTDDSAMDSNIYTYTVIEGGEEKLAEYETYLVEYGFALTSAVTEKNAVFTFSDDSVTICPEQGNHGMSIKIIIPCDDATTESRKETNYKAAVEAFNNDDYDKFFQYYDLFEEEYKDLETYRNYAGGVRNFNRGYYATAHSLFSECIEMKDAAEYLKKIEHYNGSYRYDNGMGSILYIFVNNGEVAMELGFAYNDTVKDKTSVYYMYELVNRELPQTLGDGTTHQLMIAFINGSKTDYRYTFLEDDSDGTFMVISYETNSHTTYNGIYEKYSDTVPAKS